MQARLGSPPPGLEVVGLVLRETAVVENAELRTGRRPYHRVGLSAIVEAGPVEKACRPAVLLIEFPSPGYAVHHSRRIGPVQRQHRTTLSISQITASGAGPAGLLRTHCGLARETRVQLRHRILHYVIETENIHGIVGIPAAGTAVCAGTRRVEAMSQFTQPSPDKFSLRGMLHGPFLVSDAPEYDAGMVAVTSYHIPHQLQMAETAAEFTVLVYHEEAQRVTEVQQSRARGVVRTTYGIEAPLAKLHQTVAPQGVRDSAADPGVVLMEIGTLQNDFPPVQHEAAFRVEIRPAQPQTRIYRVAAPDATQPVEIWIVRRPFARGSQFEPSLPLGDRIPLRVEQTVATETGRAGRRSAETCCIYIYINDISSVFERNAGLHTMRQYGLCRRAGQPDVAIDSGAFVVPAFFERGVAAHGNDVVGAVVDIFADVIYLLQVAVLTPAQIEAVAEDLTVTEYAVELQPEAFSAVLFAYMQMLAVPADRVLRPLPAHAFVAVAMRGIAAERQIHHPVVRQTHTLPVAVVEGRVGRTVVVTGTAGLRDIGKILAAVTEVLLHRRCIPLAEAPSVVDGFSDGGRQRQTEEGQEEKGNYLFHIRIFNQE